MSDYKQEVWTELLFFLLGWRLFRDVDDRRPEKVLQRHEETRVEGTEEADSKTEGLGSQMLINLY